MFTASTAVRRTLLVAAVLLLLVVSSSWAADLTVEDDERSLGALPLVCAPKYTTTAAQCRVKQKKCLAQQNIMLKFVGRGCRTKVQKGKTAKNGDGGCQCDGYCGFSCKTACNKDRQCFWNATDLACYSKQTQTKGMPMPVCTPISSNTPTASPIASVTASPTASPVSASPTASPVTPSPVIICFYKDSTIQLESGRKVTVDEVKYGDMALAFDPSTKKQFFSKVVAFTSYSPNTEGDGKIIEIEGASETLILSDVHLLLASADGITQPQFRMASSITNSSIVYVGNFEPRQVRSIRNFKGKGWFSPITESGTIIVNGIWASAHTRNFDVARVLYKPLYWYLDAFPHPKGTQPDSVQTNEMWYSFPLRTTSLGRFVASFVEFVLVELHFISSSLA